MFILGGGTIGLEMGTVYSTLGAHPEVVEMLDGVMQGADRDLVKIWQKMNAPGSNASVAAPPQICHRVLQAVGRTPNVKKIAADTAGVAVTDCGFIHVDVQMRTNVPHIFAIGDILGQPMLAHKAVHEAHMAAQVIACELEGNKAVSRVRGSAPQPNIGFGICLLCHGSSRVDWHRQLRHLRYRRRGSTQGRC